MRPILGSMVIVAALLVALLFAINSHAAPASTITYHCAAPTERVDGTPLAASELASYEYRRGTTVVATTGALACGYVYAIPAGECVRKGELLSVRVIDTGGLASAWATFRLVSQDYCAPVPPSTTPAAPRAPTIDRLIAR